MPFTNDDKLQWEVQKLQAETQNLARPFLRQPAFWIGLGTLMLSIGTNVLQLSNADRNRTLAKIETANLQHDARDLAEQKADLESRLLELRGQLAQVAEEIARQKADLANIETDMTATGASREALLRNIAELQQRAAALGSIVESTSRNLPRAGAPQVQPVARDAGKAAQYALEAYEALASRDFTRAQKLFQASEDAYNGFRYSYEWSRLLRTRANELQTVEGQRAVLQFALSKGYANDAPAELRSRIQQLAQ